MDINLLTTQEVAEMLKCSQHHVATLRQQKQIYGIYIGKKWMYPESEIKNELKQIASSQQQQEERRKISAMNVGLLKKQRVNEAKWKLLVDYSWELAMLGILQNEKLISDEEYWATKSRIYGRYVKKGMVC